MLLRRQAPERFLVHCAGLRPTQVHPFTHQVLREIGLDTMTLRSKGVDEFLGKVSVNYAIIVCERAAESCPRIYPLAFQTVYWPFEDPAAFEGSQVELLDRFRVVRDQIDARLHDWVAELSTTHP